MRWTMSCISAVGVLVSSAVVMAQEMQPSDPGTQEVTMPVDPATETPEMTPGAAQPDAAQPQSGPIRLMGMATEPQRRVRPNMATMLANAQTSGPPAVRQSMARFGASWQGGEQLFWRAQQSGQSLSLPIELTAGGRYQLVGSFTTGGNYGIIQVFFNGRAAGDVINLYSPRIALTGPRVLGRVNAMAGRNELVIWAVGRDQRSANYFVGLDDLELIPIP